jgi:hypothetical protein
MLLLRLLWIDLFDGDGSVSACSTTGTTCR